jgi:hypothetical protein
MSVGVHFAVYRFDDGTGVAVYLGRIAPITTPVLLSHSSISPTTGTSSTVFTFQTTYANVNGNAPTQAKLYLDGTPIDMSYVSGSYSTGAVFQAQTTLSVGKHTYFFVFSDAQTAWGDPVGPLTYAGPTIGSGAHTQGVTPGTVIGDPGDTD